MSQKIFKKIFPWIVTVWLIIAFVLWLIDLNNNSLYLGQVYAPAIVSFPIALLISIQSTRSYFFDLKDSDAKSQWYAVVLCWVFTLISLWGLLRNFIFSLR
jgi:hypothetical protein